MSKPFDQEAKKWQTQVISEAIIQYLSENPNASDTFNGIAEWWIMRQRVQVDFLALKQVLRQLTESGILEADGEGENQRYSLKSTQKGSESSMH